MRIGFRKRVFLSKWGLERGCEREGSREGWGISLSKGRNEMEQRGRCDGERAMTLSVNYLEEMKKWVNIWEESEQLSKRTPPPPHHLHFGLITNKNTHTHTHRQKPDSPIMFHIFCCPCFSSRLIGWNETRPHWLCLHYFGHEHLALAAPACVCKCSPHRFQFIITLTAWMCTCSIWTIHMCSSCQSCVAPCRPQTTFKTSFSAERTCLYTYLYLSKDYLICTTATERGWALLIYVV